MWKILNKNKHLIISTVINTTLVLLWINTVKSVNTVSFDLVWTQKRKPLMRWYAHVHVCMKGLETVFSEDFAYLLNKWSLKL